jgi:hypothetical protein
LKLFTLYNKKKRAISPVIAVILLIGLAVAASAAIFLVVMPLFAPTSSLELNDAYVLYDGAWTKAIEDGDGHGVGTMQLSNSGTGKVSLVSYKVFYSILVTGPWTEVTGASSVDEITNLNPYVIEPLTTFDSIDIRFPLPASNDDLNVYYRLVVETRSGSTVDTLKNTDVVDEEDMKLSPDRPTIISTTTLGTIRRTHTISPNPGDNSEIKNVVYEVSTTSDFTAIVKTETITSPLWRWQWNTYNDPVVSNGTYYLRITVNDYAGLSKSTYVDPGDEIVFTVDNDYTSPTINSVLGEAPLAEVGETYEITANVVDTGSGDSDVQEVFLHYRLLNATSNTSLSMVEGLSNDWSASIPIDARSMEVNMTYYIEARDQDGNKAYNQTPILEAADTKNPDITHTPKTFADEQESLSFFALVDDPGLVDTSEVFLFVRKSNDLDANATVSGESLPSSWVQLSPSTTEKIGGTTWNFTWIMPEPYFNVTIHALDYYINASDLYASNVASHGTSLVPHHIQVLDLNPPDFVGISSENFPSSWTENTSYPIAILVNDNDPTFGRIVNGDPSTFATGEAVIHFKDGLAPAFNPANINTTVHLSGNSSNGEITTWYGTIPREIFVWDETHRVDFYISLNDQSETVQNLQGVLPSRWPALGHFSIDVKETGQPNVIYSPASSALKNGNATVSLMLNNTASSSDATADATLTEMFLEVYSEDWNFANGAPNLTSVYFTRFSSSDYSYNDTIGNPHPWGGNGTWISFGVGQEGLVTDDNGYNIIELTFSNTSGGTIDMHNMVFNISFRAEVLGNGVDDQWLGLVATPGVEPASTMYRSRSYNGRHYIGNWLATPVYSYAPQGLGWDSESEKPWAAPSAYSRNDIATGEVFPYDGFGVTSGSGIHTTNTWKAVATNQGTDFYQMNIDTLVGGVSNSYVWFYSVIQFSGSIPSTTMYLGSDDEAICYINGQVAGQYGSPRGYGETQFQVESLLVGNMENNYILFGVHEIGGAYSGGLAFTTDFQVKLFTGPPPAPLGSPLSSTGSPYSGIQQIAIETTTQAFFRENQMFLTIVYKSF